MAPAGEVAVATSSIGVSAVIALVGAFLSEVLAVLLIRAATLSTSDEEPPGAGAARGARNDTLYFLAAVFAVAGGGLLAAGLRTYSLAAGQHLVAAGLLLTVGYLVVVLILMRAVVGRSGAATLPAPDELTGPVAAFVARLGKFGNRLGAIRSRSEQDESDEAADQFSRIISVEAEMSADEEEIVRGAISLQHTPLHDIMVPRVAIVGLELGTPWSEVLDRIRSSEHSRLPVFGDSLDDIVGLLVAKDLLPMVVADEPPDSGWETLLRKVEFVPPNKRVDDQLRDFRLARTHMAVVVDEYGGTAGLVTIEDVLEELVGEIRDEHDVDEQQPVSEEGTRFWLPGRLPLDELDELIGEELPRKHATTAGGIVFEHLGRVPVMGEELEIGSFRIVVERMRRHSILRLYFERMDQPESNEDWE